MYTEGKMSADLLTRSGVRRLIGATANIYREALDAPTIGYEIPPSMRKKLEEDIFVFSGFKTYHQLKEASMLLRDDAGNLKPFGQFYRDVAQIRDKYNRNWLRAEYNFATASAEMAAQWAAYAREKKFTNLQYRTALDDKVRPEHAALEGVTLPQDDPFWNTAFPPNGWNCRCNVVPVLKEDYPVSNSEAAQLSFRQLTEGNAEMFRFNPGKESVLFPPHHPYYGRQGYRHCATQRLAANDDKHDLGDPCRVYHKLNDPEEKYERITLTDEQKVYRKSLQKEAIAKYTGVVVTNVINITITATGIREFLNQPHMQYFEKNELVLNLRNVLEEAKYLGRFESIKKNKTFPSVHLFETSIDGVISTLIIRENRKGECTFYSISDSMDVSKMKRL